MSQAKKAVADVLNKAGIEINGPNDWDIQIHDERFYSRVLLHGSLGLGEAYMEKWWDCKRIDLFIERLLRSGKYANEINIPSVFLSIKNRLFNLQSKIGAKKVVHAHYDLSNELYQTFLDPHMQYSCAYFKNTDDLNTAQMQKMELICKKLELKKGDRVLDVGCGWGGLARHMATTYGCSVVGITISEKQAEFARTHCAGLPVEIRVQDYRDVIDEKFDRIVSVGMFEHVGYKNYRSFMEKMATLLRDDGLFLLHTIGQNVSIKTGNPWVEKYIFPGGMLPSIAQIGRASEGLFVVEDWHNFGPYYHKTLLAWDKNFQQGWSRIEKQYSETFYRMFRYYFNSFAGTFAARRIQLWQVVLSKSERKDIYESIR